MFKKLKFMAIIGILLLGSFLGLLITLYTYTEVVDKALLDVVNHLIDRNIRVTYRRLSGNLWGRVRLDDVKIIAGKDTISCRQIEMDYSLMDFLGEKFFINRLIISEPFLTFHSPGADSGAAGDSGKLQIDSLIAGLDLENWPEIRCQRLFVRDGSVSFHRGTRSEVLENIQIASSAVISGQTIEILPEYIHGDWTNQGFTLENLTFQLTGNKNHLKLNRLALNMPHGTLKAHGEVSLLPRFQFALTIDECVVETVFLRNLSSDFPFQQGFFTVQGNARGTPEQFQGQFHMEGTLDSLHIKTLKANYRRQDNRLFVEDFLLAANFGEIKGSMTLLPGGPSRVDLQFMQVDLQKTRLASLQTALNGNINLVFDRRDIHSLTGSARIVMSPLSVTEFKADSLRLDLAAVKGNWTVKPTSRLVIGKGSVLRAEGSLSHNDFLDLTLRSSKHNLHTLFEKLNIAGAGGTGDLGLHLSGPLTNPSVNGWLYLDSLTYKNSVAYAIEGRADIFNIVKNRQGTLDLKVATGFIGQIFLTSGEIQVKFLKNRLVFDPIQFYSEENSFFARGIMEFRDDIFGMLLQDFKIQYQDYILENTRPTLVTLANDTLSYDIFSLKAEPAGSLTSSGYLAFNGNSLVNLKLQNIRLEPLNQYVLWNYPFSGYIDAEMELFGALEDPEIILRCFLRELAVNEQFIGHLDSEFLYRSHRLGINYFNFERDSLSYITVNGGFDIPLREDTSGIRDSWEIPLDMNIVMENLRVADFAAIFNATYPVNGTLSGRLDLSGTMIDPEGFMELRGDNLRLADYQFPHFYLESRILPSKITVEQAMVNFVNTDIRVSGEKTLQWDPRHPEDLFSDKYFKLNLNIVEDSLNFFNVLNPEIERLTGNIDISISLEGDYDHPFITDSHIGIKEGVLSLSKLENRIEDLFLEAHIENQKLIIEKFTARSPKQFQQQNFLNKWIRRISGLFSSRESGGQITGSGTIELADLQRLGVNLALSFDQAYVNYFLENTRLVVSSDNLTISGRDTIAVTGDLLIHEGEILPDFVETEKNELLSSTIRENPPFITYDLDVEISPDFYIRNNQPFNTFDFQLSGNLRLVQRPRLPLEIYGILNTSGKYIIQGEDFEIESGKINFVSPKELPELDIYALKRKNNLLFNLHVQGPIDSPEKEITIQDELGNTLNVPDVKDQMALLLFGVTFNQLGSGADSLLLLKGEQVLTQAVIGAIEKEARTFTGLDQIRLDSQDSFFKNRLNQSSTTLALGKFLTSNLYLEYKARLASSGIANIPAPQLSWEAGNQIYLEYRLNRNWSFSTSFQKTQEGNDKVSLDISWQVSF